MSLAGNGTVPGRGSGGTLRIGRVRISRVVERAGPTPPRWLLPDAFPEAVERHRDWLAPHFLDASGKFLAVITGDLMHHPIQCGEPDWNSKFCDDPLQARATRRAFLERYGDRPVRVLGTHFASPTAGHIVHAGRAFRFHGDGPWS